MTTPNNTPDIIDAEPVLLDSETQDHTTDDEIDDIVQDLVGLGRMWARHGITLGKMALKSTATTLNVTSDVLGRIASRVGSKHEPRPNEA